MILEKKIKLSLGLNTAFAVFEFFVGIFAGSLALVSDSAHNLTDSFSLLISFFGQKFAQKKATEEHTFGYGKASILTALINSIILVSLAAYIWFSAYTRLTEHTHVQGGLVIIVAIFGIIVNGTIAKIFYDDRQNLNIKSSYINMLYDTFTSGGALLAGVLIYFFAWEWTDTAVSIAIGFALLYNGAKLINQAVHVLLEGVPENLKTVEVKNSITAVAGVQMVDDLHIWSIGSQKSALNCRLIPAQKDFNTNIQMVAAIKKMLAEKYGFNHVTIELALEPLPPHEH
jgi:cobalt-zinc-cadmium efflux system protein